MKLLYHFELMANSILDFQGAVHFYGTSRKKVDNISNSSITVRTEWVNRPYHKHEMTDFR
jgi:hypothetical protein